jgi:UDP-glucose 4-epimerase
VRQLCAHGADVVVLDNLVNGKQSNLDGITGKLRFERADVRDLDGVAPHFENCDLVYHLACLGVRHSVHSPVENHDVNATGTLRLLELAKKSGVERFVYVSSSEIYGTARHVPMSEDHPIWPMTVYGAGKLAGECYTRAFWETYRYPTVVVRPFNAFGPRCHHEGDSGEVIPKFMLRAMAGKPLKIFGDGTQTRDFSFVSDTARGILLCGVANAAVGQTINIGSGKEITINELARSVSALVADGVACVAHDAPRPGDVLRLCADTSKARALIDYAPTVELREGLAVLYSWYRQSNRSADDLLAEELEHNWTGKTVDA